VLLLLLLAPAGVTHQLLLLQLCSSDAAVCAAGAADLEEHRCGELCEP
jgi:hypothetical protein